MVALIVAIVVCLMVLVEGAIWAADQLRRTRSEVAYWDARANRPALYDWERDLP